MENKDKKNKQKLPRGQQVKQPSEELSALIEGLKNNLLTMKNLYAKIEEKAVTEGFSDHQINIILNKELKNLFQLNKPAKVKVAYKSATNTTAKIIKTNNTTKIIKTTTITYKDTDRNFHYYQYFQ